jgi:hypothetical protein
MLEKLTEVKQSELCQNRLPCINIQKGFLAPRNNSIHIQDIPLILDFFLAEFRLLLGTVTNLYIKHAD